MNIGALRIQNEKDYHPIRVSCAVEQTTPSFPDRHRYPGESEYFLTIVSWLFYPQPWENGDRSIENETPKT